MQTEARSDERRKVLEEVAKLLDELQPLPASEYIGICAIDQDAAVVAVRRLLTKEKGQ